MDSDAPGKLMASPRPVPSLDGQDAPLWRANLTRLLVRISRDALQGDALEPILKGVCDCLVAELPVPIASIILLNESGTHFIHEVWAGDLTLDSAPIAIGWPVTRGAAGRCARLGRAQLIRDVEADPDYEAGNPLVRSEYLIPIRHGQRLHGVLNIESERSDFFDAEACAVFDAVADLIAAAIHFARLAEDLQHANRKLKQLSMIDGLTGIANRRRFDQCLHQQWERCARNGEPLALLMVDADAFKPLNDALGHLHGDECLREIAGACSQYATEKEDLAARYGGEELVLLLPGRTLVVATRTAETLRAAIFALNLPHPASPVAPCVTVSIGVAVLYPTPACQPEQLTAVADRAMYAAKSGGRNRVAALLGAATVA